MSNKNYIDIDSKDMQKFVNKVVSKEKPARIINANSQILNRNLNTIISNQQVKKAMKLLADA